jgi:hypothetical protein
MRSVAVSLLVILLLIAFLQPLIEMSNVLKEKVTLSAAILNSCRAARNNALVDEEMRDLNAQISEELFKQYFAEAFCETLELNMISPSGSPGDMVFSSSSGRWNNISVSLSFSQHTFSSGREGTRMELELSTPYVFRMSILRELAGLLPDNNFEIIEVRSFDVQIIN